MRKLFTLFFILSVYCSLFAQERTQIPYSIYGLGKIQPKGFSRNFGMGRSGIALSSPRYLNNINPASYYNIDSISFFFDFGLGMDAVNYRTRSNESQQGNDINIKDLAIGFRINKKWTSSFGLSPYSSVGYKIVTRQPIEGAPEEFFTAEMTGGGGLNQFYWNNSYKIFKGFNLGVSFNYLFGNIKSTEKVSTGIVSMNEFIEQTSYYHKVFADFGFQYFFPIQKDLRVTVGGIFGNSHKINIKNKIMIYNSQGNISEDETLTRDKFSFPGYLGGGLAVNYKDNFTVTFDYIYSDWSSTNSNDPDYTYENTNVYRLGAELIPGRYATLGYFGTIAYRAGLYYEQSYLKIDGIRFADKGITFGLGLPFMQSRTTLNLSYNLGFNGTLENDLIKENYHSFMFSIAMHDWWFIKRKYN